MDPRKNKMAKKPNKSDPRQAKQCGRREFLKGAAKVAALGGAAMLSGCGGGMLGSSEERSLRWKEYFKKNYRLMTQEEKDATIQRLAVVKVTWNASPPV
jgi:molybdopterin-containing oxidoreductase family iron-sulfur binding subunit